VFIYIPLHDTREKSYAPNSLFTSRFVLYNTLDIEIGSKRVMDFISTYGKEIVSLLVPFITWFLNVGIRPKAKLIWTSPHSFTFLVQEPLRDAEGNVLHPSQKVATASIKVINTGRDTANKIELIFNWKPQYINLWPVRHYDQITDPDGRHI